MTVKWDWTGLPGIGRHARGRDELDKPGRIFILICDGVYPRGCGGTSTSATPMVRSGGLSPRVRGNPGRKDRKARLAGSIPAGAGEPWTGAAVAGSRWVYPRGCGGTLPSRIPSMSLNGLSPRVRGNLALDLQERSLNGSIPAGAGEPRPRACPACGTEVYPRGCGGTVSRTFSRGSWTGLSPRVRGNHWRSEARSRLGGSIPAGAGEPLVYFL